MSLPGDGVAPADAPPVLEADDLRMQFSVGRALLARNRSILRAVDGVSFDVTAGQTLGIVGESGSGKTTVARLLTQALRPTSGTVRLDGDDLEGLPRAQRLAARRRVQMIFQDPGSSFDRRALLIDSLEEPLIVHEELTKAERRDRVIALADRVGLSANHLHRYPSELSGGQLQRLAIARALTVTPEVIVCDEPVSSLDVSIQAQVINLLVELQDELGIAYVFIAHDLSVVAHVSHRIAVMYLGRIVEQGDAEEVGQRPRHPYTQALLSAVPYPDPVVQRSRQRIVLGGEIPSPLHPPVGCHFAPRCPYALDRCATEDPPTVAYGGIEVACHLHEHGPQLRGRPVGTLDTPAGARP